MSSQNPNSSPPSPSSSPPNNGENRATQPDSSPNHQETPNPQNPLPKPQNQETPTDKTQNQDTPGDKSPKEETPDQEMAEAGSTNQEKPEDMVVDGPVGFGTSLGDYGFLDDDEGYMEEENVALDAMYSAKSGKKGVESHKIVENWMADITLAQDFSQIEGVQDYEIYGAMQIMEDALARTGFSKGPCDLDYASFCVDDESLAKENAKLDAMYAAYKGSGSTEKGNTTGVGTWIPTFDDLNKNIIEFMGSATKDGGMGVEENNRKRSREIEEEAYNPKPVAKRNEGVEIRGFRKEKGKGKGKGRAKRRPPMPVVILFSESETEEEDDIQALKFVSVYARNLGVLPAIDAPERCFVGLFVLISDELPEGQEILMATLRNKFRVLALKYVEILRRRRYLATFEANATEYEQEFYRLGMEVWGYAYAEGFRFLTGRVGPSGTKGDSDDGEDGEVEAKDADETGEAYAKEADEGSETGSS